MVAAHVLGSVLVWVATLRFHLALTQPVPAGLGHRATADRRRRRGRAVVMADGRLVRPRRRSRSTNRSTTPSPSPTSPWIVLVWNDPINLMTYVSFVFQKLFGYPREKADRLMMQVHEEGRAVVANGPRETCELHVFRLHEHGLWATMQHDR